MNESYYHLLDVPRGLPGWKLTKRLYEVFEELTEAYGGALPMEFKVPLATLEKEDQRDQYDSFLEWAEEGAELEFGEHKEQIVEVAEKLHHFQAERLEGGRIQFRNRGVPDPPPPAPPESLRREAKAASSSARTQAAASQAPSGEDAFGRVNRRIPPVRVGDRVFQIDMLENVHLVDAHPLDNALQLLWSVPDPGGQGREWATREFHGLHLPQCFEPGRKYFFVRFRDVESRERTDDVIFSREAKSPFPVISSQGTWGRFPWHLWRTGAAGRNGTGHANFYARWEADYPGRRVPNGATHFGRDLRKLDFHKLLAHYAETAAFWAIAHFNRYEGGPAMAREHAKHAAADSLHYLAHLSPREIAKLGLPKPR